MQYRISPTPRANRDRRIRNSVLCPKTTACWYRIDHSHEPRFSRLLHDEWRVVCMMCPLCQAENTIKIYADKDREYLQCQTCQLVFVPSIHYLSADDEKARYNTHQNSPDDPKYRAFLSRLFIPMQNRLAPGSHGLDFGSGPGPTLSVMFEEAGHSMAIYDHFYALNHAVLDTSYDFITATEVVEHLHHPRLELDHLWAILKPGGILGIMTRLVPDHEAFAQWYYKNDPTHVCFFSRTTFEWLATQWQAALTFEDHDVMLFPKSFNPPGERKKLSLRL